ncbi:hypothetical protein U1Q18_028327 [Sarracenia purpurea var. burkii]
MRGGFSQNIQTPVSLASEFLHPYDHAHPTFQVPLRWLEITLLRVSSLHFLIKQLESIVQSVRLEYDPEIFAAEMEPSEIIVLAVILSPARIRARGRAVANEVDEGDDNNDDDDSIDESDTDTLFESFDANHDDFHVWPTLASTSALTPTSVYAPAPGFASAHRVHRRLQ